MKKNNRKFRILGIFSLCLTLAILVSSLFMLNSKKDGSKDITSAVNYVDDSTMYIQGLLDNGEEVPNSFSLDDEIYIISENQSDPTIVEGLKESSMLCWIFASMKVLETSIMVQQEEYHNFSETATALLGKYADYLTTVNADGNFVLFDNISHSEGLVYESEFTNDYFLDIKADNVDDFSFVKDYANTDIMKNIKYLSFDDDPKYKSLSTNEQQPTGLPSLEQQNLLKKYIKTYGGIYAGLNKGVITTQSGVGGVYKHDDNPSNDNRDDKYLNMPHAVCLIGWDSNGFIALNSWGRDTSDFDKFYIPYSEAFYGKLYGYICLDAEQKVSITDASQTEFSTEILNGDKNLSNIFNFDEDFSITYQINDTKINFDDIYVNIFSGKQNVSSDFDLDPSTYGKIKISSRLDKTYSGTYLVKIYSVDQLVSVKDFYVYTGADLSYVSLIQWADGAKRTTESIQLKNTLASNNVTATYYISNSNIGNGTYTLKFFLPEKSRVEDSSKVQVSELYKTATVEGVVSRTKATEIVTSVNVVPSRTDVIQVNLTYLTNHNTGSLIDFSISITAPSGATKVYYFNFFISSITSTETHNANTVIYMLDGGKNDARNVTRYPDYKASGEINMTMFELQDPTKDAATFVGWYLTPHPTEADQEVEYISSEYSGTLILYAVWLDNVIDYYEASLKIDQIKTHDATEFSNYVENSVITYGDTLKFLFSYKLTATTINSYNYYTRYHITISGFNDISGTITKEQQQAGSPVSSYEEAAFPTLAAGEYTAILDVTLVINRSSSISAQEEISFTVEPKSVTATFEDLTHIYDGAIHTPTVVLDGVYSVDTVEAQLENTTIAENAMIDVGTYNFVITGLSSNNYVLSGIDSCVMTITPAEFTLNWGEQTEFVYNGYSQNIRPQSSSNNDIVVEYNYVLDGNPVLECRDVGSYTVEANVKSANYQLVTGRTFHFSITKKHITLKFNDVSMRFTLAPNNRPTVTWTVDGLAETDSKDDLSVTYKIVVPNTNKPMSPDKNEKGVYDIVGTCESKNYEVEVQKGTYTILGEYYVFYTLPDGTIYTEVVQDGEDPKGVPKDVFKAPLFGKLQYSEPLKYNAENTSDMYIKVTYTNYTWVVIVVGVVLVLVVVYFIASRKTRGNKNR